MSRQLTLFFTALQFYTRLAAPGWVVYKPEYLNLATAYLPLIGWLVGLTAGGVWVGVSYLTDPSIAVLCSMIASILLTGAFHEDGFADVCDGFGGGWTRDKILEIMKDSRLGTYGTVGLLLILGLKFALLLAIPSSIMPGVLIGGHAVSRLMPVFVIYLLPYARGNDSKAKPVAEKPPVWVIAMAVLFGMAPLLTLMLSLRRPELLLLPVFLGLVTFFLARYFRKWIGGYTGDCLGAIQQVCEIGFYFLIVVVWKFI